MKRFVNEARASGCSGAVSELRLVDLVGLADPQIARFWAAGDVAGLRAHILRDVRPTFLTLNPSPTGGTLGQPVTVASSLTDISSIPAAPIANANVTFTLGNSACAAVTDINGLASCVVTPSATGLLSLNAVFQGTANYVGSTASVAFNALGPVAPPPPPSNKCPSCLPSCAHRSAGTLNLTPV